ncbi:MAG TPA: hypothetical protein VM325_04095 [Alphaproteobacteria bacterium]|nr:hypothetical protein [Alphaproteobacteria bacterium]
MKKTALIAAAFAAISTVAMAVSPAHATAVSPAHAEQIFQQIKGIGAGNTYHPKDGFVGRRKVGPKFFTPKTCYERKRVGPQNYVIVRRAC